MYFPYLRGKQFEILAVRESGFLSSNRIVPIFEPTTDTGERSTRNRYKRIAENEFRFAVIINSDNGTPPPAPSATIQMINDIESRVPGMVIPAFEIRAGQPISQLKDFSTEFAVQQRIIIHRNHTHSQTDIDKALAYLPQPAVHIFLDGGVPLTLIRGITAAGKILLRDGFKRCVPNATYPSKSNFDDLLFNYKSRGYDGFADFSIIGDVYSPGGGAAKHVAIHLTENRDDTTIVTNHFVSTTPPQKGDTQAKYFSALQLLASHAGQPLSASLNTQGMREYYRSNANGHFPGLGKLKQWSIMHHMESIDSTLGAMGINSFI